MTRCGLQTINGFHSNELHHFAVGFGIAFFDKIAHSVHVISVLQRRWVGSFMVWYEIDRIDEMMSDKGEMMNDGVVCKDELNDRVR